MIFIEYSFNISHQGKSELLIAILSDVGFDSFNEENDVLRAYVDEKLESNINVKEILQQYPFLEGITFAKEKLEDKNWNAEWENNFKPITIDESVIIRAGFHKVEKDYKYDIIIDPKMSFGTGHHATTRLMIKMMLEMDFNNKTVLDFGCGTAVLAILAKKMGAGYTLAIDNDEWAYNNSIENINTNNELDIETIYNDQTSFPNTEFDVILANVNRNVLTQTMQILYNKTKLGGTVLISGLLTNHEAKIMHKATDCGFSYVDKKTENDWICINLAKK